MWRPAFPHVERVRATLRGYTRRFWQGSPDHRGVPDAPGRVVTLVADVNAVTVGVAYRVLDSVYDDVLRGLDVREAGGYERRTEPLELSTGHSVDALVYLATERNPEYLGPAPIDEMAAHVIASTGPSGANREYVLELDRALHELDAQDAHVSELAEAVRKRLRAAQNART